MNILIGLTYYRPHVSGLTIYVQRLAHALAERGHYVTVLTSQYDRSLPRGEMLDGAHIIRVPVVFRISKGVVMPTIGLEATRQVLAHDVISLHLPQFDAAGIALRGRLLGKPTVITHHSDVLLPPGWVNFVANRVVWLGNHLAAAFAHRIVAYTQDFADSSSFLSRFKHKLVVILPPVTVPETDEDRVREFANRAGAGQGPIIGFAARLAADKGVEILLQALPRVLDRYPHAQVLFAGPYQNVIGEAGYARKLAPLLARFGDHWRFLGVLDSSEMACFFRLCDLTVLPSLNSTETFGLVQIESMISGTPVVASGLPGVRQPVLTTGMGRIVPIGDSQALAEAIIDVLTRPAAFQGDGKLIAEQYSPAVTAQRYESLFDGLLKKRQA